MSLKSLKNTSKAMGLWPSSKRKKAKQDDATDNPRYFNSSAQASATSQLEAQLDKAFEALRSDEDPKDAIGVESSMAYLSQQLKINLEDASLFVALEMFQAPSIGEITRKGFIQGWRNSGASTTKAGCVSHMKTLVSTLSRDHAYFKKVYRYAFVVGKEPDQRALSLENAMIYWSMLFSAPGLSWESGSRDDWLELWTGFLKEKWTRSVNRDMWNMTLEFALRSMEDESLRFWNEDGAWPSVIDDFVAWCRENGIAKGPEEQRDDVDMSD